LASIHVIQGPDKGRTYELAMEESILGRDSETLQLNDPTVSRGHARLIPQSGAWLIEDLGSANGTYVNGVRLRRLQSLQQGDQLRVGSTLLVFGGPGPQPVGAGVDIDEDGRLVESAIISSIPSNEDSVIMPTPEAGEEAIGNLRHLYNLIRTISTIFDVDLLLNRVLDQAFELLKPDRGYILMLDKGGGMALKAVRYRNPSGEKHPPISRTIVHHVVTNQVGVLCTNAMSDQRFTKGHSVHAYGIRSALCVPIKGRDRILGVLHVDSSVSNYTYSTEQLRLLTAIGYQTGLAVENVQLYAAAVKSERLAAVGETVAALSHHIKNILQALRAGADVVEMAMGKSRADEVAKAWPIVTRNLDRINGVILNMLAFSKPRQPLLQMVKIDSVVEECVQLVTPGADEKGVAVLSDMGDVPPIPADADGLHQALLNLLTNALDAVPDETGVVTVAATFDPDAQEVKISVTDNGAGLAPEARAHLFEPFYSTKGQRGTGLGLAVTQKVVAEHGGRIDVRSVQGEGATFTITLSSQGQTRPADETHGPGV